MTLTPDQEMAYKLVELHVKHGMNDSRRKDLTLDKIMEAYWYALGRIQGKVDSNPLDTEETTSTETQVKSPSSDDTDALSSNAFSFLD